MTVSTQGTLTRWKQRWFGHTSEAERQVKRLQRQGSLMAHVAHSVATLMLLLISLATLITLGKSTGQAFLESVQGGNPDWMKGLAIVILFALVVSMDTAVLYGSNMLRVLFSRGLSNKWMILVVALHAIVVVGIAALEGFTYWIMILTYEHPTTELEYHVGQFRAFGAPAIAIYLALATVISITKADILNIGAVQSGIVAVQKVSELAGDERTPLAQTWRIFDAASGSSREDDRVQRMIVAVTWQPGSLAPARVVESFPSIQETAHVAPVTPAPSAPVTPTLPARPAVTTAEQREDYDALISAQLTADPTAGPTLIAATLGLPVGVVCQYLARRISSKAVHV